MITNKSAQCGILLLLVFSFKGLADEEAALPDNPEQLQDLLHWAIGQSDPDTLKAMAKDAETLLTQRANVQDLAEELDKRPTEAKLMKAAISVIANLTYNEDVRIRHLVHLRELVEPIDNANDLHKMGGLEALSGALSRAPREQAAALAVISTCASNNVKFQETMLQHDAGIIRRLLVITTAAAAQLPHSAELTSQALSALSAMTRNLPVGLEHLLQPAAGQGAGDGATAPLPPAIEMLLSLLRHFESSRGGAAPQLAVVKKAVALLSDVAGRDSRVFLANRRTAALGIWEELCLKLHVDDADMAEKSLAFLTRILRHGSGVNSSSPKLLACLRRIQKEFKDASMQDVWLEDIVYAADEAHVLLDQKTEL